MWVSDSSDDKLFAYEMPLFGVCAVLGERDTPGSSNGCSKGTYTDVADSPGRYKVVVCGGAWGYDRILFSEETVGF